MKRLQFATIVLFALALVPVGAHLLEMTNKMSLDRDTYMIVQHIYDGWDMLGGVLIVAVLAGTALTIMSRTQRTPFWLALTGTALLAASLGVFFTWTFPMNVITHNWTVAPDNWVALRQQWEYSHALDAVITFAALCCITGSALAWKPDQCAQHRRACS